ncbi:oligosaccharide flippase family protein [Thiothrix unzii]|jgi:O-antigen/teichoic acid export membrane protein|uniref:lipopolysaccharide biosynthesis protein n=1 Tax=Thiothrix unzii TaxID=111769 RepID=UPI002A3687CD|nr:oligosaccharide flippase family protein [Thiothrix unzii]MDX9988224.1 oligosaccharide flippase family protein [Thiothrix unzii]
MKKHINNSIIVILGQVIASIIGLLGIRLLTEYLSPTEYGELTLGLTVSLIVNQLLIGPLGSGVTRFYCTSIEKQQESDFISATIRLLYTSIKLTLVFAILAILLLYIYKNNDWIMIILISILFSILTGINAIINGIWLSNNYQLILSINQCAEPLLRITGGISAILLIGSTGINTYAGFVGGTFIILTLQLYIVYKKSIPVFFYFEKSTSVSIFWQKEILQYSYPFAIWGLFTTIHLASDKWILQLYYNSNEVGYYAVLYQIGYIPMTMLTSAITQFLTPILFKKAGDGSNKKKLYAVERITNKVLYLTALFVVIITLISFKLSSFIFSILVANQYQSISNLLPLLILSGGVFGIGQIAVMSLQSQNKTKTILKIKIISAVIGVIFNVILGIQYGLIGMAFSLLAFSLLYTSLIIRSSQVNNQTSITKH